MNDPFARINKPLNIILQGKQHRVANILLCLGALLRWSQVTCLFRPQDDWDFATRQDRNLIIN